MTKKYENEHVLDDNSIVFREYLYVAVYADGKEEVIKARRNNSVKEYKKLINATHIKNCDIGARDVWDTFYSDE